MVDATGRYKGGSSRRCIGAGEVATSRGMIRFDLGSLKVCGITDEIMVGILGTEGMGGGVARCGVAELEKNFS